MPFDINLNVIPPEFATGLIEEPLPDIAAMCASTVETNRDRNVWRGLLGPDGYSRANMRHTARIKRQTGPSCGSAATTGAVENVYRIAGLNVPTLSIGSVFAFVGSRAGSTLSANMRQITTVGCVPESMWPSSDIYGRKPAGFDAEAPKWRLRAYDFVPDFDAAVWALFRGRPVIFGVNWSGTGHLIYGVRVYFSAAKGWGIEIANSWGTSWGEQGFGILYEPQISVGIKNRYGAAAPVLPTYTVSA